MDTGYDDRAGVEEGSAAAEGAKLQHVANKEDGSSSSRLRCDCGDLMPSLSAAPAAGSHCWVRPTRGGVSSVCRSDRLLKTAIDGKEDDIVLCLPHLKELHAHMACFNCFIRVVTGTVLVCPDGHRTDPLCSPMWKQRGDEGETRSCSHCGSTVLSEVQLQPEMQDADESQVAEFTKMIEEVEKAKTEVSILPRSTVDEWKARMRALAPGLLTAYRQAPRRIGKLAVRMLPLLPLMEIERSNFIEKLCDLRGVNKPGDPMPDVTEDQMESFSYEGDLGFRHRDVVFDPDLLTEINDEQKATMFCDCDGVCVPGKCSCHSGVYGIDPEEGEIHLLPSYLSPEGIHPISECGPACGCRVDCGNRLVQTGGKGYPLELVETLDRGKGVRTRAAIPPGRFIAEYTGTLRELDDGDVGNKYCFETELGLRRVEIDSRHSGSAARCFNHSCEPNAMVVKVAWDPVEARRFFHLAIFSLRRIEPSEEVTIDYGDKFWLESIDEMACRCGTTTCRHDEEKRQQRLREREEEGDGEEDEDESEMKEDEEDEEEDDDDEVIVKDDDEESGKEEEEDDEVMVIEDEESGKEDGEKNEEEEEEEDDEVMVIEDAEESGKGEEEDGEKNEEEEEDVIVIDDEEESEKEEEEDDEVMVIEDDY